MSDATGYLGASPGLAKLQDNIQVMVAGIALPMVDLVIANTLDEFHSRSTYKRQQVWWNMGPGVTEVDLSPFDGVYQVAHVLDVTGLTTYQINPPGQVLDLGSLPTALRHGSALLALKPLSFAAITATGNIAPELWSEHFETLLAGTLARLCAIPGRPWTDPKMAEFHLRTFRMGIQRARAGAADPHANGSGAARWGFPYFARGRRR